MFTQVDFLVVVFFFCFFWWGRSYADKVMWFLWGFFGVGVICKKRWGCFRGRSWKFLSEHEGEVSCQNSLETLDIRWPPTSPRPN